MCRLADPTAMVVESCAVPLPAFSPLLQRNYRYFFAFVTSTTLLCVFVFSMTAVYVKVLMDNAYTPNGQGRTVWQALAAAPMSVVLMAYTFVMVWFVGGLTAFHTYLMSSNQVSAAQGLCIHLCDGVTHCWTDRFQQPPCEVHTGRHCTV